MISGIALNPSGYSHYTDHLAPICSLMDIPLFFTDETEYEIARSLYIDVACQLCDPAALTARRLVKDYQVLFISDLWTQGEYFQRFGQAEQFYHKGLRVVHCPHGYSDKEFWLSRCAEVDIS